jgi:hypothetical protein
MLTQPYANPLESEEMSVYKSVLAELLRLLKSVC